MLSDRHNKYTCEDLLQKVNKRLAADGFPTVSGKRVIQLDIQALQEAPFNMEIDNSDKLNGAPVYRYADPAQSLFNKQISDDEKRLLQEVLNTLGQFSGLDNFAWMNDLQNKLNDRHAFGRTEYDEEIQGQRKIISFSSNDYLTGKNFLGILFTFISNRKVVDVVYEPFGQAQRTIRLYPYLLKQYNERWYLIGTPLATEEFPFQKDFYINLPLDRMKKVLPIDGVNYIDCDEDFEDRYEDIIGVSWYKEKKTTDILLAVKNIYACYIDTKPIHGSQRKFSADRQAELHDKYQKFGDYTFYGLSLKPNRELYNTIYRNGDQVILISPDEIRKEMIAELTSSVDKLNSVKE